MRGIHRRPGEGRKGSGGRDIKEQEGRSTQKANVHVFVCMTLYV